MAKSCKTLLNMVYQVQNQQKLNKNNNSKNIKNMKNTKILSFFLIIFITSCKSELSNEEAKLKIISQLGLPSKQSLTIREYENSISELLSNGLLIKPAIEEQEINYSSGIGIPVVRVTLGLSYNLTEKGKQHLSKFDDNGYPEVIVGDLVLGEITGISRNEQSNITEVHYTLVYVNKTPFGEVMLGKSNIEKVAYFQKFDDGWRIQ